MRALVYDGQVKLQDLPVPSPAEGEALVRVTLAGICNTDLEITQGYMGFRGVLGHEFVGVVVEASNETLVGRRVVGEINCVCHHCRFCQLEMPHHCLNRSVLGILKRDGAFAEYLTLPEENLHLVPETVRDEVAVFAEPTAAAFRILEQISIASDDRAVVLGDGKLGQLIGQVIGHQCKNVICVGKHRWKMDLLEKVGVATAHFDELMEPGVDVVVEATGSQAGLQRALDLVRPEGTIVLKTTLAGNTSANLALPVINEVTIVGSRCGPFRPAMEALALGNVEVAPLVSETYPLAEGCMALERARDGAIMKVLLHM
jgi:threonine dehydrogenase-like Zn-dependent dehydrogenase